MRRENGLANRLSSSDPLRHESMARPAFRLVLPFLLWTNLRGLRFASAFALNFLLFSFSGPNLTSRPEACLLSRTPSSHYPSATHPSKRQERSRLVSRGWCDCRICQEIIL